MTVFEFRQWFESLFPWWLPFAIALSALLFAFAIRATINLMEELRREKR